MRESCLVYCYSGIQSLFEVVLLYTFYTFGAGEPGIENWDSTALKNVLNEIVVNASWKHVGDMSQSEKKKLKNLRKFRNGHRKFVEKTIEDAKGLIAEGNLVKVKRLKFLRTALETKYSELQSLDREIVDLVDDVTWMTWSMLTLI